MKLEDAYFSKFAVAHEIFTKNCIQQGESSNEMDVEVRQTIFSMFGPFDLGLLDVASLSLVV